VKKQLLLSDPKVTRLWRAFYASLIAEELYLENPSLVSPFCYDFESGELCFQNWGEYVDVSAYEELFRGRVRLKSPPCTGLEFGLEQFNRTLALLTADVVKRVYLEKGLARERAEFAFAIPTSEGKLVVVEGSESSLLLPAFPAFAFFHTHPSGACAFSDKDWRAFVDFVLEGGFVNGVISRGCLFVLYRSGPLSEDDIVALRSYVDKRAYLSDPFLQRGSVAGVSAIRCELLPV